MNPGIVIHLFFLYFYNFQVTEQQKKAQGIMASGCEIAAN